MKQALSIIARPGPLTHRLRVGLLVTLLGLGLAAPAAAAERVLKLGYEVYLGGLNIFDFDAHVALNERGYRITGGGKTKGAVRLVWRWGVDAVARGEINGRGVEAKRYDVTTQRRKRNKELRVTFKGNGAYDLFRKPKDTPHRAKKRELPDVLPPFAVDPVSAAMVMGHALGRGKKCAATVPVFDGDRRYDLTFSDLGDVRLSKPGYSTFSGTARHCRLQMKKVSGFRKQKIKLSFWDDGQLEPPQIWLSSLSKGLPPVPVKFQADFNLGYMMVYLVEARYGGRVLVANKKDKKKEK